MGVDRSFLERMNHMGKIILCTGQLAETGWLLGDGRRLYSVEELCWYVYEKITELDREFFREDLFRWLEQECGMPETAAKLARLKAEGYSLKDLTVTLLCSADYYTEEEILTLLRQLKELDSLPEWQRRRRRAQKWQRQGQSAKAAGEYERILAECELDPEEQGLLYHDMGVARIHLSAPAEAAECFYKAWHLHHRQESLKLCLLAYRLGGLRGEARRIESQEQVSPELIHEVEDRWLAAEEQAGRTIPSGRFQEILRWRENGQEDQARLELDGLLTEWQQRYRIGLAYK